MTNALAIALDDVKAAGFFEARGGVARLLKRESPLTSHSRLNAPNIWARAWRCAKCANANCFLFRRPRLRCFGRKG
jgi:hypothetical protein